MFLCFEIVKLQQKISSTLRRCSWCHFHREPQISLSFFLSVLRNLRILWWIDISRIDHFPRSIWTAANLAKCAQAIPQTSTQQEGYNKDSQTDPREKFLKPIEAFFVVFGLAVDSAIHPVRFVFLVEWRIFMMHWLRTDPNSKW